MKRAAFAEGRTVEAQARRTLRVTRDPDAAPPRLTRQVWVVAHRWAGLTITVFLVVVGFTGALLPWNEELILLSRPRLAAASPPRPGAPVLDGVALAERVERRTGGKVGYIDLNVPRGHVVILSVAPRTTAGRLPFDTVWVDPYTGEIRLSYRDAALTDGPQAIMSFLYRLHTQLALGRAGELALGLAALVWTIDCFVGFYLTLPVRRKPLPGRLASAPGWWSRWRPAWRVRWGGGAYKLTFDLHRAGGLWVWPLLFVFAWSSVGMNLPEVSTPVMAVFGGRGYQDIPKARTPLPDPAMSLREARTRGSALLRAVGQREGFSVGPGSGLSYYPDQAAYRYDARSSLDVVSKGGRTTVYFSAVDGHLLKFDPPVDRNPADAFMAWLYMLHFAEVAGLPYRMFVSFTGLLIVMLSVTGVLIWMRKRSARLLKSRRDAQAAG